MTFKEWPLRCAPCGAQSKQFAWDHQLVSLQCAQCGELLELDYDTKGESAGVVGDEIPGGLEIRHGLCNPDGSPRKYYSKTDIKRAANERGYTIAGDTPRPYNVKWSGRQKRADGVKNSEG